MKIKDLIYKVSIEEVVGSTLIDIEKIQYDSRKVEENDVFVAINGVAVDGHNYIDKAISNGAIAIVCERIPETQQESVTYIKTHSSSLSLGVMAANYYENPSRKLKLIGITGTNGKTTTTTLLHHLFQKLKIQSALISTIKIVINDKEIPTKNTTPDILITNQILVEAINQECEYVFMEVSSHGIHQNRIAGLEFFIASFSNITHDHLDYHKTFKEYLNTKKKFFDDLKPNSFAITNLDDKNGNYMLQNTKAKKKFYALKTVADYKAKIIENQFDGMLLEFNQKEFWTTLIGEFNAYNLLNVYAIASLCELDELEILTQMSSLENVDGRFQIFHTENQVVVIVDYAHTPDALQNVLNTIQNIRSKRETLITIVGCGGDRDKEKRPEMAKISCLFSDQIILTSDNPRTEQAEAILADMEKGIPDQMQMKSLKITDRKQAIKAALSMAKPKDIILIAGKGHESYQEIQGVKYPFNDFEIAKELSKLLKK